MSFTPLDIADASPPDACTFGSWSTAMPVTATTTAADESDPSLTPDGLSLYFYRGGMLYVVTRESPAASFGSPTLVSSLSSATRVAFSPDGLDAYYQNGPSIWHARFLDGQFTDASPLPVLGTDVAAPSVSGDGAELYLSSSESAPTDRDVYRARRLGSTTFATPEPVAELNTGSYDAFSTIGADDLTIFFESDREGIPHVFSATRPDRSQPFSNVAALELGGAGAGEGDPWLSYDGRELYWIRRVGPSFDILVATRTCE